ncbi:MAG: ABC transporter permease [Candidatus Nanopelagicales bacterium]
MDAPPNPWFSWDYIESNIDDLLVAAREHVLITIGAVVLAMAITVPLALAVRRLPYLKAPVLGLSDILYTIPSLALIAGLWPVFGLSPWTVIVALALYALLVLLRNVLAGLESTPPDIVDAASGLGYSDRQFLWRVQLPLAVPAIMGGLRIATVSTVGLVTIGALVGHGGFGTIILGGFISNFYRAQIFAGTVAVVALALILEALLLLLERALTPWARRGGR